MSRPTLFILAALILAACTPQVKAAATTPTATAAHRRTVTAAPTATATTPAPPSSCTVDAGGEVLNVRRSPGMQSAIIGGLLDGTRVTVTERGQWLKVQVGSLTGFIYSDFCK